MCVCPNAAEVGAEFVDAGPSGKCVSFMLYVRIAYIAR